MPVRVAKFGGSSLADEGQIRKVIDIVRDEPQRRHIVVSAPGLTPHMREAGRFKVTDLLYSLAVCTTEEKRRYVLEQIRERFRAIVEGLGLSFDLHPHFEAMERAAFPGGSVDYLVSRGEYLMARILADALGFAFCDAADLIRFDDAGGLDMLQTRRCAEKLFKMSGVVIPGFYGATPEGSIRTFTRGGSDLTGAIIAAIVRASVYENWTDVSGILMADPALVPNAIPIPRAHYREVRELAYSGARVLHDEVIAPLQESGTALNVRNTNRPDDPGTEVVPNHIPIENPFPVIGIAARPDFVMLTAEKMLMNPEIGFMARFCDLFARNGVSIEHTPGGIDTVSAVVAKENLGDKLKRIRFEAANDLGIELQVEEGIALICTVGEGMVRSPGIAAQLFGAVANADVNVRMIDQGASETSIIIGVDQSEYDLAVQAIYESFIGPKE